MFDLVVRGGRVVTPKKTITADVAIEGERIAAIGPSLAGGKTEIDAAALTVLPGLIDIHLHFNEPGRTHWEGAATGSRALAAGGGTLFFDMPLNSSPCTIGGREFDEKRKALETASITDFALWGGIVPDNIGALAELAERGVVGFKAFLCNSGLPEFPRADDLTLFEGMREAARLGLPVAVHAESEELTKGLAARLIAEGRCDIRAFLESRPVIAEVEAIHRACMIARETKCKLHVVHVSSGRGVMTAIEARALGADVSIETCPHYLLFTEDDLIRIGAVAKCAPPLRSSSERDSLWAKVASGMIDAIASDHSPCPPEMKQTDSFFSVWGGIAGVQFTRSTLFEQVIELSRIVGMTAGYPALRFNMEARGAIEVGYHADLALIDTKASYIVREEMLFQRHKITPYLGRELRGVTKATIRRGEVIYSDGKISAKTNGRLTRPAPSTAAASPTSKP